MLSIGRMYGIWDLDLEEFGLKVKLSDCVQISKGGIWNEKVSWGSVHFLKADKERRQEERDHLSIERRTDIGFGKQGYLLKLNRWF